MKVKCYRIDNDVAFRSKGKVVYIDSSDIPKADVQVKVIYSSVNYKDALAGTGKGRILKKFPLNGGIDFSGVVLSSGSDEFKPGDEVLANGNGLSEIIDGGYSQIVNIHQKFLIKKPDGLTLKESMILGTAGFTAALCVHRMLVNGQSPDKGPILVTGATGGVGSFAINLFSKLGYEVIAMTSKLEQFDFLTKLGASKVTTLGKLNLDALKPLGKGMFGGAVDNLGGDVLTSLIPHINLWGNIASVGLASGFKINTTVMPFILRGVSILGISSNNCDMELKKSIWSKLANELKPDCLDIYNEISLDELDEVFAKMLERKTWGRTIVKIDH